LRAATIILLVMIPSFAVLNLAGLVQSQSPIISFSTTSEFSTLTIGTTTLAQLTTSSYNPASGYIPGVYSAYEGPTVCFYVPYLFHVDASAQRIQGTISGSSPFNFYIMSKPQYDYFVLTSPPCGSSYQALKVDYSIKSFTVDWVAPHQGDYYILLENTSMYVISYTIQVNAIEPSSTLVYSTTAVMQTLTFITQQEVNTTISTSSESASASQTNSYTTPIAIALVALLLLIVALAKRFKRAKPSKV
jgi:hypothetical protein